MYVTLITGASAGIGAAFARRLAAEQHNLLLVARSESKLRALCAELKAAHAITADYVAIDLTEPGADQVLFAEAQQRGFDVDWLINNAGIGSGGDFLEYDQPSVLNLMHLNMDAMVALTHRFLPQMRARKRGTIVNVGSMAGFNPIPYMAVYAASKAFVLSFTEALTEENRPYHVQTMLLCPGATETNFFDAARIGPDRKSSFSTKTLESPEQVVHAALAGLKKRKGVTISGLQNKLARFLHFVPNSVIVRLFGKQLRANLNLVA